MRLLHEDPEFADLLRVVARDTGLGVAMVEKDYWVTHALWALGGSRLAVWFKGGTSLSKGFGLIERFSEDLDLRIEPGADTSLPAVASWTSGNRGRVAERRAYFESLASAIAIPGATVVRDRSQLDEHARGAVYQVRYPGQFKDGLAAGMRPFVQLEVGIARVSPFVPLSLGSFVHDWLWAHGQAGSFRDNRPVQVRTVHPLVTLVEKLDAITRRYGRDPSEPASFVRHYEDAARIVLAEARLPPLPVALASLIEEMATGKDIARIPEPDHAALVLVDRDRRSALERAHQAIGPMFWGRRIPLAECCALIRSWLRRLPPPK